MARTNFTTPVGRLVQGSLYHPQDKDADGNPLTIKNGPNAGQPKVQYYFGVAIPKGSEQHWNQTEWGQKIWKAGVDGFPQGQYNAPTFAWKITDGDSNIPNKKGKRPCDKEGYKGHWVLNFSSGFAPRIFNADGSQPILDEDAVKPGYYIQVNGDVDSNGSSLNPGVYLNHELVALSAYGPEINLTTVDATAVGFGASPLPAGASPAPLGGGFNPAPAPAPAPSPTPNPAFLQVPPPVAPPAAPPVPPAVPVRQMTALANGATYDQMVAAGWTDDLLVQHGMMVAA